MIYSPIKLFQAIQACTQSLNFIQILDQVKDNSNSGLVETISSIYKTKNSNIVNNFIKKCYVMVLIKLSSDIIVMKDESGKKQIELDSHGQVLELLHKQAQNTKRMIKEDYCQIMQSLRQRKCQTIEILLFIVCYCAKTVLLQLCDKYSILKYYFFKSIDESGDQLPILACVLINFYITGVIIKQNAYLNLKNKFCGKIKNYQNVKKKNQKMQSNKICSTRNTQRKQKKLQLGSKKFFQCKQVNQNNAEKKDFFNEVKGLLSHSNSLQPQNCLQNYKKKINTCRKWTQNQQLSKRKSLFDQFDNNNNKIGSLGYATVRNSCAFQQQRNQLHCNSLNKRNPKSNFCVLRNKNKNAKFEPFFKKEQQRRKMGMNLISASLKFFFGKQQKKNYFREVEKPTIADWKKKITKMQSETNLERVRLNYQAQKFRKATKTTEEDDKNIEYVKYLQTLTKSATLTPSSQNVNPFRHHFSEFEQQNEHRQIGIVRSVVNFNFFPNQQKHKKTTSKQLKGQYRVFVKKMQQNYDTYLNQNNFNIRLQKVLTGTNRL